MATGLVRIATTSSQRRQRVVWIGGPALATFRLTRRRVSNRVTPRTKQPLAACPRPDALISITAHSLSSLELAQLANASSHLLTKRLGICELTRRRARWI
eukprot:scaffold73760_cov34-Tisochrysis_lutea.AAC.3